MPATPSPSADGSAFEPPGGGPPRGSDGSHGPQPFRPPAGLLPRSLRARLRGVRRLAVRLIPSRLVPRSFRARLALVISAVVAFALILVLAVLPRLLDSYFSQQETQNLQAREAAVAQLLAAQLRLTTAGGLVPLLAPTTPLQLSSQVVTALTGADESGERSFLAVEAQVVAQADLTVQVYAGPSASGTAVATLRAPLTGSPG